MPRTAIFITTILLFSGIFVVGDEHTAYAAGCIQLGYQGKHTLLDNISLFLTNESCSTSGDYSIESFKLYQKAPSFDAVQNDLGANVLRPESYNIVNVAPKKVDIQLGLFGVPIAFPEPPWVGKGTHAGHIVSADNFVGDDMVAEDAIIEAIQKKGTFTVSGTNTGSIEVPATNCVKLSGDGPKKIVFMRGKSWDSSVSSFVQYVEDVESGFGAVYPFSENMGQYSFYIDLKKVADQDFPLEVSGSLSLFKEGVVAGMVKALSSCSISSGDLVYLAFDQGSLSGKLFPQGITEAQHSFIYVNMSPAISTPRTRQLTAVHEAGHYFGRILDEYTQLYSANVPFAQSRLGLTAKNCTTIPRVDYRFKNILYGSINIKGCVVIYSGGGAPKIDSLSYYRPSMQSIMDGTSNNIKFNVIDCGYILAGLRGETPTKANAQKYWPECLENPGVESEDVPPANPTPSVNRITPSN